MNDDILIWLLPDIASSLRNHYAVAGGGQPLYTLVDTVKRQFWQIKNGKGYPWDCNTWDDPKLVPGGGFVRQNLTDGSSAAWNSPTAFHQFAPPLLWAPRFINLGGFNPPLVSPSTYKDYTACGVSTPHDLGGFATTQVQGPYKTDFGGDLGTQWSIIIKYLWGFSENGYENMELNYYTAGYDADNDRWYSLSGLAEWQAWELTGSIYTLKETSLFNTLVDGGVPTLDAPCGVPA